MDILKIFLEKDLNIIDKQKLQDYIEFCQKNNKQKHTKFETEHHHILPKSIFPEYKNLRKYSWNGVFLSYQEHYESHELLCLAIKDYKVFKSLEATRNKNRFGEITDSNLYAILKEQASKMHSEYMNNIIEVDGKKMKQSEYNMRNFSNEINKEIVIDGIVTTKAKEIGKKTNNTLKNEKVMYEGKEISKMQLRQIKRGESARKKGKWYDLFDSEDNLVGNFPAAEIRKIYKALEHTSKEKPLGCNERYRFRITKKEYIGYYVKLTN